MAQFFYKTIADSGLNPCHRANSFTQSMDILFLDLLDFCCDTVALNSVAAIG